MTSYADSLILLVYGAHNKIIILWALGNLPILTPINNQWLLNSTTLDSIIHGRLYYVTQFGGCSSLQFSNNITKNWDYAWPYCANLSYWNSHRTLGNIFLKLQAQYVTPYNVLPRFNPFTLRMVGVLIALIFNSYSNIISASSFSYQNTVHHTSD